MYKYRAKVTIKLIFDLSLTLDFKDVMFTVRFGL